MDYEKYFKEWILDPAIGSFNLWSYIDLRDCAEAFRLAIEADLYRHEVFCIAAPNSRSIKPTKELIENYYPNVELRLEFKDHESLEDSSKAEKLLGFKAKHIWNEDFNINEL
jgi:nucleoside-diphosphate-sugar epimerase